MKLPAVLFKDCTMREGLDVPGVALDSVQKKALLQKLAEVGVPEVEIVAPGHFERDVASLKKMGRIESAVKLSGLIYASGPDWRDQIAGAQGVLDRVDILMQLSDQRPPAGRNEKAKQMKEALAMAIDNIEHVGVGFPHATQVEPQFVLHMCHEAVHAGARRITLYDTNGSSDPWAVSELIIMVREEVAAEICFHAHNDLGMATANSVAAALAGVDCLDVTVNGLGDRAGNASMEQVAVALYLKEIVHGLRLDMLMDLSRMVGEMTSVPVSKLAPIVGDYVFQHKSPGHLKVPELFEPFDPALVGAVRSLCKE